MVNKEFIRRVFQRHHKDETLLTFTLGLIHSKEFL